MEKGEKHDEGYEQAFIDAYIKYTQAIELSNSITMKKPNIRPIKEGQEKAKYVLGVAKEELDNKYKEDLKNEMERFKNIELNNMRTEENKKYVEKIEQIRQEYDNKYEKK